MEGGLRAEIHRTKRDERLVRESQEGRRRRGITPEKEKTSVPATRGTPQTMRMQASRKRPISLGRHSRNCSICAHQRREEIEREFINWTGPKAIAKDFGLRDRTAIYRHAHALDLFSKRQRNIRAALEKIIERAGDVEVTAAAVVAAVQAYGRLNAQGQWIDRVEHVDLNKLFDRMTEAEMEAYAKERDLPGWFKLAVSATRCDSQDDRNAD